ncbi:CARDB domain-containing protein [Candidatus Margulisiibacteriota bacterium]
MRKFFLLLVLFALAGCSVVTETDPDINLVGYDCEATASRLYATIKNTGSDDAGSFKVKFYMDAIYVTSPESKTVTVDSLAAGGITTVETYNTLSSSDGDGQHFIEVYVDYDDEVDESNEVNNYSADYYYDGDYEEIYNQIFSNLSSWRSSIRSTCQDTWGWPASGTYYMHFMDEIEGSHGVRTTRMIEGSYTSVLLFNLSSVGNYSRYPYQGELVRYNSSQEVVAHEYVHAYHREYVTQYGSWNYPPTWFKEGMAVYTAGQGVKRVRYYIDYYKDTRSTSEVRELILAGVFGADDHAARHYAGDYLAIRYMVAEHGSSKVKSIMYDNANGQDMEDAIVDNLGMSWVSFKATLRSYTDAVLEDYWGDIYISSVDGFDVEAERERRRLQPELLD